MIFFHNLIRSACYGFIGLFILLTVSAQFADDMSLFSISARTEYFEGVIGGDGATFSTRNARICAMASGSGTSGCGGRMSEVKARFSGRITLPNDARLRLRRSEGPMTQLFLAPEGDGSSRLRLDPEMGKGPLYVDLPVRLDLRTAEMGAPMMINVAGHSATIGAIPTRDTSGLRNALREGEVEVYGIGLWWRWTGDPTAPVAPSQLFLVGGQNLYLGDSVRITAEAERPPTFWATLGLDPDAVIEVSLRAVGKAAVVERFGGAGLSVEKSWIDTLVGDPLFQLLWSAFGTLIALASIQFLGRGDV